MLAYLLIFLTLQFGIKEKGKKKKHSVRYIVRRRNQKHSHHRCSHRRRRHRRRSRRRRRRYCCSLKIQLFPTASSRSRVLDRATSLSPRLTTSEKSRQENKTQGKNLVNVVREDKFTGRNRLVEDKAEEWLPCSSNLLISFDPQPCTLRHFVFPTRPAARSTFLVSQSFIHLDRRSPLIDASRYLEDDSIVNREWELIALGRERYREQQDRQLEDSLIGRGDIGKERKEKEGRKGRTFRWSGWE